MKKIIGTIFLGLFLVVNSTLTGGCANNNSTGNDEAKTEGQEKTSQDKEVKGKAIYLTKQMFLDRVMNYEVNTEEWVYEGTKPAIIDFYADWCAPCRIASPVLDELAAKYEDEIIVYKVDTEKEQELAAAFGIQSIPAFLWVPVDGKPTMSAGIARTPEETKQMFDNMIQEILLNKKTDEAKM